MHSLSLIKVGRAWFSFFADYVGISLKKRGAQCNTRPYETVKRFYQVRLKSEYCVCMCLHAYLHEIHHPHQPH